MSAKTITIDPISRVEGHGKVTIDLDEKGGVSRARFHVTQFRGFEVFTAGRPFEEMPIITQRICGICPVSHQLASAKACDAILGVEIPPTARLLRELLHLGQFIQSHALHFFYLASPDLLLGWDADPAVRNVVGVVDRFPEAATKGIRLRKFGQEIISALGGKRIHPAFAVPGGVTDPLSESDRDRLLAGLKEAEGTADLALELLKGWLDKNRDEAARFARFDSLYAGLVDPEGRLDLYDGRMRVADSSGKPLVEFDPEDYLDHLAEHVEDWSYLKFPYYKAMGWPEGIYRVGPLGRLMAVDEVGTPKADAELAVLRGMIDDGLKGASLLFHYARLIELVFALEKAAEVLADPRLCLDDIKVGRGPVNRQGVGVVEAPRGTLIHHYWVDGKGVMEKANLIVATGHNNMAMNKSVELVAREYINDGKITEGMLNRVEGAIRCYDPCLSCSTHALGRMPLHIQVRDAAGRVTDELCRD